ncbi:hypothetical protein G3480_06250 [Thiorhodococcus mannitoliphagus]|uniref:Uncharacterized protein n=1 Tax=Thiorhodococcus mannitoliphagus TaxID=329406 RepID=A0A6P1DPJ0_9GAMM|nr:hypothetical protein [Thiorhodococcus mannitoliphagus]NEX19918.1 hypothetical protein [Thiorhodococcus mannitoliphagus]
MSDAPFDLVDTKESFTDTDWFETCRKTQTPYVVVRSGEARADVLWDFVTLPPSCDTALRADFAALERNARAIFERFAVDDSYLRVKPTMICFDHLPVDDAKRAAQELYGLIASYLPSRQRISRRPGPVTKFKGQKVHDINLGKQAQTAMAKRRLWVENNGLSASVA